MSGPTTIPQPKMNAVIADELIILLNDMGKSKERHTKWYDITVPREKAVRDIIPLLAVIPSSFRLQFVWINDDNSIPTGNDEARIFIGCQLCVENEGESRRIRFLVPALPYNAVVIRETSSLTEGKRLGARSASITPDGFLERLRLISMPTMISCIRASLDKIKVTRDDSNSEPGEEGTVTEFKAQDGTAEHFLQERVNSCVPPLLNSASVEDLIHLWVGVADDGAPVGLFERNSIEDIFTPRMFPPLTTNEEPLLVVYDVKLPTSLKDGFIWFKRFSAKGAHARSSQSFPVYDTVTSQVIGYTVDEPDDTNETEKLLRDSQYVLPRRVYCFTARPKRDFIGVYVKDWQNLTERPDHISPLGVYLRLNPLPSFLSARLDPGGTGFLRLMFQSFQFEGYRKAKFDAVATGNDFEEVEKVCFSNSRCTRFVVLLSDAAEAFNKFRSVHRDVVQSSRVQWEVLLLVTPTVSITQAKSLIREIEILSSTVVVGLDLITDSGRSSELPSASPPCDWLEDVAEVIKRSSVRKHPIANIVERASDWMFRAESRQSVLDWDIIAMNLVVRTQVSVSVQAAVMNALNNSSSLSVVSLMKDERGLGLSCGVTATLRIVAFGIAALPQFKEGRYSVVWLSRVPTPFELDEYANGGDASKKVVFILDIDVCDAISVVSSNWKTKAVILVACKDRPAGLDLKKLPIESFLVTPYWRNQDVESLVSLLVDRIPFKAENLTESEKSARRVNLNSLVSKSGKRGDPLLTMWILSAARNRYVCAEDWVREERRKLEKCTRHQQKLVDLVAFVAACADKCDCPFLKLDGMPDLDILCRVRNQRGQQVVRFLHPYLARIYLFAESKEAVTKDPFPSPQSLLDLWKTCAVTLEENISDVGSLREIVEGISKVIDTRSPSANLESS